MRTLTIFALLALLVGCDMPDPTAIKRADSYVAELLEENDPASLECPSSATVGDTFQCNAENTFGTNVDRSLLKWRASPDSVGQAGTDGVISTVGAGSLIVTAVGPTSSAADTVAVQ